jgi:hypothetical protein
MKLSDDSLVLLAEFRGFEFGIIIWSELRIFVQIITHQFFSWPTTHHPAVDARYQTLHNFTTRSPIAVTLALC